MKTKRRHELETNELADWLGQTYRSIAPYANRLLWGAVILAAAVLGTSWLIRSWRVPGQQAAVLLSSALAPHGFGQAPEQLSAQLQDYQTVANEYPDTVPGKWARLMAADSLRQDGMRRYTTDRDGALAALRRAEQEYEDLIKQPSGMELLDERALLGRAKTLEALNELNNARGLYEELLARHPAQEITVDAQFGQPEQLDRFLARRFKEDRPDDLLGAIRSGLVEIQQQGQWQPADRRTLVEPGTKLRVQFDGLHTLEAKERLAALDKDEVVNFYKWVETAEPPPIPELPTTPSTETPADQPTEEQGIIPEFTPEPGQSDRPEEESGEPQAQPDQPQANPDQPDVQPKPGKLFPDPPQPESPDQPKAESPSKPDEPPEPDAPNSDPPQNP